MGSVILRTATIFMLPLLLLFSVFLLLRGHNQPGGGFTGGLVGTSALALYGMAFGVDRARHALAIDPRSLMGAGLVVALSTGLVPLWMGTPLLTHRDLWFKLTIAGLGTVDIGSPFFFDLGVYMVVLGAALTMILSLAEELDQ